MMLLLLLGLLYDFSPKNILHVYMAFLCFFLSICLFHWMSILAIFTLILSHFWILEFVWSAPIKWKHCLCNWRSTKYARVFGVCVLPLRRAQPHESKTDDIQNRIESHIDDGSCATSFASTKYDEFTAAEIFSVRMWYIKKPLHGFNLVDNFKNCRCQF